MQPSVKVFVLYHQQNVLDAVPDDPMFHKINLNKLSVKYNSNMIGEGRAFLANLDTNGADYVGFVNARWDNKYHMLRTKLSHLPRYIASAISDGTLSKDTVLAPWTTDCSWLSIKNCWYDFTVQIHPTMRDLLHELSAVTKLQLHTRRRSFWANDFICHRLRYLEFVEYWRKCFRHFHGRYGYLLPFSTYGVDTARYAAYFYERCSTMYWANRTDLAVTAIP